MKKRTKLLGTTLAAMLIATSITSTAFAEGDNHVSWTPSGDTVSISTYDSWDNILVANVSILLSVREEPSTDATIVGVLRGGGAAQILERGSEWTKIKSGNVVGYVKNDLCVTGDAAKAMIQFMYDGKVVSGVDGLNVRASADLNAPVIASLQSGQTATVNEEAEEVFGWTAVTVDGQTGYVSTDYSDLQYNLAKALTIEEEYNRAYLAANPGAVLPTVSAVSTDTQASASVSTSETTASDSSDTSQTSTSQDSTASQTTTTQETTAAETTTSTSSQSSSSSSSQTASNSSSSSQSSQSSSDSSSTVSDSDLNLLAALIWCEARGESFEGQVAVGAVVMNRVASGSFPNSISGVIYESGQFSPASSGSLARALSNGNLCLDAAKAAINGTDPTNGALYFHAGTSGRGTVIGHQIFY